MQMEGVNMNKLVRMRDVQDAIDNLEWYSNGGKVYVRQTELVDAVDSIPAVDAVEVVRCRECLRSEPHYPGSEFFACELLGTVRKNDYCCYGQRREDGDA